jgi:uncharacterized UBP type Zn finger protein
MRLATGRLDVETLAPHDGSCVNYRGSRAPVSKGLASSDNSAAQRQEIRMSDECAHAAEIRDVTPSALGCEECLRTGSEWLHLRLCRTCGHVGCCDESPNRHATRHFHQTGHPVIEG